MISIDMNTLEVLLTRAGKIVPCERHGARLGVQWLLELCNPGELYTLGEPDSPLRAGKADVITALPIWASEVMGLLERRWSAKHRRSAAVTALPWSAAGQTAAPATGPALQRQVRHPRRSGARDGVRPAQVHAAQPGQAARLALRLVTLIKEKTHGTAQAARPLAARFNVKFHLRPGEDDDLIQFFADLPTRQRAAAFKVALRSGGMAQVAGHRTERTADVQGADLSGLEEPCQSRCRDWHDHDYPADSR